MKDSAVKIDRELEKQVELFLKRKENKFIYTSKKQIVNLAIIEFLKLRQLNNINKK
jgi:hypothetical protein